MFVAELYKVSMSNEEMKMKRVLYPKLFDSHEHRGISFRARIISFEPGGWAENLNRIQNAIKSMSSSICESMRILD
jgi:hypothetical protein